MLDKDVTVAFSSDWPVSNHEPLNGIAVAVNRRETLSQTPHNPNQALTVEQAMLAYTTSVKAMRASDYPSPLGNGSSFDIVLLNQDIFEIPSLEIGQVQVLATYKQGRRIF